MEKILKILQVTFISIFIYSCASSPPDTYKGAWGVYDADYFDTNRTIEFKYKFRYLMPTHERLKFESKLENSNYKSDSWTKKMQSEGFNALAISATGTNAFSAGGQAAGLALSLFDDYLRGRPEQERFFYMVFSDEWLGKRFDDADKAHEAAKEKTLNALRATAHAFDYEVSCKYDCEKRLSVFELTSTNQNKYIGKYHPKVISAILSLSSLEKTPETSLDRKVFSSDSNYKAKIWNINLLSNESELIYTELKVAEYLQETYKQKTFSFVENGYALHQTPLGRQMLRSLSASMPNWVVVNNNSTWEFALTNGELYDPQSTSSAKGFYGARTTED